MRLELQQPGPGGKPHLPKDILLDIDAGLFFKTKSQTGRTMIEEYGPDGKEIPLNKSSVIIRTFLTLRF